MKIHFMGIVVALVVLHVSNHISPCTATFFIPPQFLNFLKSSCDSTTYPTLCNNVLKTHSREVQTNPKALAGVALNMAFEFTKQTQFLLNRYCETKGLDPAVVTAMRSCGKELGSAVEMLQKSKVEMDLAVEGNDASMSHMSNVETCVNTALTSENACSEAFSKLNLNGNLEKVTSNKIVKVAHLTSNALALIKLYASGSASESESTSFSTATSTSPSSAPTSAKTSEPRSTTISATGSTSFTLPIFN